MVMEVNSYFFFYFFILVFIRTLKSNIFKVLVLCSDTQKQKRELKQKMINRFIKRAFSKENKGIIATIILMIIAFWNSYMVLKGQV